MRNVKVFMNFPYLLKSKTQTCLFCYNATYFEMGSKGSLPTTRPMSLIKLWLTPFFSRLLLSTSVATSSNELVTHPLEMQLKYLNSKLCRVGANEPLWYLTEKCSSFRYR